LSTTLAVVAVFIPVAFMGGQIGKIFYQFGVTVAFAVLVSLFVSFTLDPMLSSIWADPELEHGGHAETRKRTRNPIRKFAFAFEICSSGPPTGTRAGSALLATSRTGDVHRGGVDVGAGAMYPLWVTLPDFDAGEFDANSAPRRVRVEYTTDKGHQVAALVRQMPEVQFTYMTVGGGGGMGRGSNSGTVYVRLADKRDRLRSQQEIQTALRAEFPRVTGVRPSIGGSRSIFGGMGQPIRIYVQGPEVTRLKLAAEQVMQAVARCRGG
jgi:HAE1 family hydrophobic/amphiphilic exporter-1